MGWKTPENALKDKLWSYELSTDATTRIELCKAESGNYWIGILIMLGRQVRVTRFPGPLPDTKMYALDWAAKTIEDLYQETMRKF